MTIHVLTRSLRLVPTLFSPCWETDNTKQHGSLSRSPGACEHCIDFLQLYDVYTTSLPSVKPGRPPPRDDRITYSSAYRYIARHPRGSYILLYTYCLWKYHQITIPFIRRCYPYARNSTQKRFLVGCSSPFMRLTQNLTTLRASCKRCLPGR